MNKDKQGILLPLFISHNRPSHIVCKQYLEQVLVNLQNLRLLDRALGQQELNRQLQIAKQLLAHVVSRTKLQSHATRQAAIEGFAPDLLLPHDFAHQLISTAVQELETQLIRIYDERKYDLQMIPTKTRRIIVVHSLLNLART